MTTAKTKFGRRSKKELIIIGLLGLAVIGTLFEDRLSSSVSVICPLQILLQSICNTHMICMSFMLAPIPISSSLSFKHAQSLLPTLRGKTTANNNDAVNLYIPPGLDINQQRRLSLNLGGGACKWTPPNYTVPPDLDFHKTIIAGFPSGDKRMIFTQMEALTGWPAKVSIESRSCLLCIYLLFSFHNKYVSHMFLSFFLLSFCNTG